MIIAVVLYSEVVNPNIADGSTSTGSFTDYCNFGGNVWIADCFDHLSSAMESFLGRLTNDVER